MARFSAMGDVAMTIPVLYSAAMEHPDTLFTLLTKPGMTGMFINAPANLRVEGLDLPGTTAGDLSLLWRTVSRLNSEARITRFVDLHDVLRTRIIALICLIKGIPVRHFRKARLAKKALTWRRWRRTRPVSTTIRRYADALRLGPEDRWPFTTIFNGGKGDPALFAAVTPPRADGEHWIGIAPFARHEAKRFPDKPLREVIDLLQPVKNLRIFLFGGGPEEQRKLDEVARSYDNITNVAGRGLGLKGELALISHLDAMMSMDSANMHLAALTGIPVISVWGGTHPSAGFTPFRQPASNIVQANNIRCRPCSVFGNKPCPKPVIECMFGILPEHIADRLIAACQRH